MGVGKRIDSKELREKEPARMECEIHKPEYQKIVRLSMYILGIIRIERQVEEDADT